jgi:hypothetical protein
MGNANWMRIPDFSDKYNVSRETIYVMKHRGTIPACAFKEFGRKEKLINETYILKKQSQKMRVYQANEDLYYDLLEYNKTMDIARALAPLVKRSALAVNQWFGNKHLFYINSRSILYFRIPKIQLLLYRNRFKLKRILNAKQA